MRWPVGEYTAEVLDQVLDQVGPERARVLKDHSKQLIELVETHDPARDMGFDRFDLYKTNEPYERGLLRH